MSTLYLTKPGDTINKIIERFNYSMSNFEKRNDVSKLRLIEGLRIFIPIRNKDGIRLLEHVTEKGETLANIMEKYQANYDLIKYFNNFLHLILEDEQEVYVEAKLLSPELGEFSEN
ncbi:MAG TPA: LysM peptidoglycan-binding domain-containing protein [Haloplasmataceae bacterium]